MYNNILQHNLNTVKNKANVFSLVGEDRATLGSDLSALISPPTGERTLAVFMSRDTSGGGVQSDKPNLMNLEGDHLTDNSVKRHDSGSVSISVHNSKHIGILNDDKKI